MPNSNDHEICCSFCGKHQEQVARIIAGPGAYICNECVQLCMSILEDESDLIQDSAAGRFPMPSPPPGRSTRCWTSISSARRPPSGPVCGSI